MPDHDLNCPQAPSIQQIGRLVEEMKRDMSAANERQEKRDTMLIEALQGIANQDARIVAQQDEIKHVGRDVENLFERVRGIEESIGKDGSTIDLKVQTKVDSAGAELGKQLYSIAEKLDKKLEEGLAPTIWFFQMLSSKPFVAASVALVVMVVVGSILDLCYHFEGVAQIWAAWKQLKS